MGKRADTPKRTAEEQKAVEALKNCQEAVSDLMVRNGLINTYRIQEALITRGITANRKIIEDCMIAHRKTRETNYAANIEILRERELRLMEKNYDLAVAVNDLREARASRESIRRLLNIDPPQRHEHKVDADITTRSVSPETIRKIAASLLPIPGSTTT